MATYDELLGTSPVERALARLRGALPLQAMRDGCDDGAKELHRRLLQCWLETGAPLKKKAMEESEPTAAARAQLEKSGLVIFSPETGEVTGAYPFTTLGGRKKHRVLIAGGKELRAMCALDALAVGPIAGLEVTIRSQCDVTGDAVAVQMAGKRLHAKSAALSTFVGIGFAAAVEGGCCATTLCSHIVFLKDAKVAEQWRDESAPPEGGGQNGREIFCLEDAVQIAQEMFQPFEAALRDPSAPMETEGEAEAEQSGGEEDAGAAVTQVDDAEETEFQLLGTRPTAEYFGQLESGTSSTFHGTDMLESEDEYVDEQYLANGTWGSFEGVPNFGRTAAQQQGPDALSGAPTADANDASAARPAGAQAEGGAGKAEQNTAEKEVTTLHWFSTRVHAKAVQRLVVASFASGCDPNSLYP